MGILSLLSCCTPCFPDCNTFLYIFVILYFLKEKESRSRWPHDLSGRSVAAGLLGLRVQNSPVHGCLL